VEALPDDDPERAAYLRPGLYNRRDMVMNRLNDYARYRREVDVLSGRFAARQLEHASASRRRFLTRE
jgi:hypothetical protein